MKEISPAEIVRKASGNFLALLEFVLGLYICPESNGQIKGPLVAYAGRDDQGRQLLGKIYANFAKIEENSPMIWYVAEQISQLLAAYNIHGGTFCGAPIGGYRLADTLGDVTKWRVIKAEKKVTAIATAVSREVTRLVMSRYDISPGEEIILVEDICNNFSTTDKMIELIEKAGGKVVAIVCYLNRSTKYRYYYPKYNGREIIPIIALVQQPMEEFDQDNPVAMQAIKEKNVVWEPKKEWPRLLAASAAVA